MTDTTTLLQEVYVSLAIIEAVARQLYSYNKPNARLRAQQIDFECKKIRNLIKKFIEEAE